jgi:hypothetical protein
MMKKPFTHALLLYSFISASCNSPQMKKQGDKQTFPFSQGEFGYDLQFLRNQDQGIVVLKDGEAQLIVSPKYQAKVFTSTASGERGLSFGWINYKAFGNKVDAHMNAYGGENRIWLGPEGGNFSLFFKPDSKMVFDNWKTPAAIDTESWNLRSKDNSTVTMYKEMKLVNYKGTKLVLVIERSIKILGRKEIIKRTSISDTTSLNAVGYETDNVLTNKGDREWTSVTGLPCIWILDMFKPSTATIIVVPFHHSAGEDFAKITTSNYFGEISSDRLKHTDSLLFFKADGRSRGKLGIVANKSKHIAGSYDADNKVLTIIIFDVEGHAKYLNQEWNITKPSFSGDAVNAYNDGPLADGTQMGPFYEIESVSPAAFLKPNESLLHRHSVFHFSGNEKALDEIAVKLLGTSLENITKTFSGEKVKY